MIIVTGGFTAKEGCFDEALELSLQHVRRSRTEPGCISHAVTQDVEQKSKLFFYEQWSDMQALQTHFAVPESGEFVRAISELATTAPELNMFQAEEIQR